jgi:hypothetical protein
VLKVKDSFNATVNSRYRAFGWQRRICSGLGLRAILDLRRPQRRSPRGPHLRIPPPALPPLRPPVRVLHPCAVKIQTRLFLADARKRSIYSMAQIPPSALRKAAR